MSRIEKLNSILGQMVRLVPDIEASALISEDGLMIASAMPTDVDETIAGGMAATLLNLGTRTTAEFKRGDIKEVFIRGTSGYTVMQTAAPGTLLLVLAGEQAKQGLVYMEMRTAIDEIKNVL